MDKFLYNKLMTHHTFHEWRVAALTGDGAASGCVRHGSPLPDQFFHGNRQKKTAEKNSACLVPERKHMASSRGVPTQGQPNPLEAGRRGGRSPEVQEGGDARYPVHPPPRTLSGGFRPPANRRGGCGPRGHRAGGPGRSGAACAAAGPQGWQCGARCGGREEGHHC